LKIEADGVKDAVGGDVVVHIVQTVVPDGQPLHCALCGGEGGDVPNVGRLDTGNRRIRWCTGGQLPR
jgi:hypothetical protein